MIPYLGLQLIYVLVDTSILFFTSSRRERERERKRGRERERERDKYVLLSETEII